MASKVYEHDNGRKCRLMNGHWVIEIDDHVMHDLDGLRCGMDHWIAKTKVVEADVMDGHPTLGSPGRVMMPPIAWEHTEYRFEITEPPTTPEGRRIAAVIPTILERFFRNNTKYARAQSGHDLGAKGIIPDINRKTSVLIDREWYGAPVVGEGTVEVIDDLIGHLLLMRDKMTTDTKEGD